MPNEAHDWIAIRARITALEYEVYNWSKMMPSMVTANLAEGEVKRAEIALATAQRELSELRELLAFWEERNRTNKIPVAMQASLIASAIYMAVMLLIVVYLLALSGG